jgi:hypothetical protein
VADFFEGFATAPHFHILRKIGEGNHVVHILSKDLKASSKLLLPLEALFMLFEVSLETN